MLKLFDSKFHPSLAESLLESVEGNQNFSILLLNIIDCENIEFHVRVTAAVTLKNFIKRNWRIVST